MMKKKHFSLYTYILLIIAVSGISLWTGCPFSAISEEDMLQIEDHISPELLLYTPPDNSNYPALILLEGVVADKATQAGTDGRVASLSYEIIGTSINEEISIGSKGEFSHSFSSAGLDPVITLTITARDWNKNETIITRTLYEGAFPSFTVTPGNQSAALTWDPVTQTESYTLLYTTDSSAPAELNPSTTIEPNVTSPLYLDNLDNGYEYSFVIKAVALEGPDNYSGIERAIPLSPFTLAPGVTPEYNGIKIQWKAIPGATRYIVERDTSKDGSFSTLSSQIAGTSYYDTTIVKGVGYYYRVIPAGQFLIHSEANYGVSSPFPSLASFAGMTDTPHHASDIALLSDYAFVADWNSGLQVISIEHPTAPVIVGSVSTGGNARGIYISGDYAYIANDSNGLKIINITQPATPVVEGTCLIPGSSCIDVAVSGDYAYVAAGTGGIHVINISDPEGPGLVDTYTTGAEARAIIVEAGYAYIADGKNNLHIASLSDPEVPVFYDPYSIDTQNMAFDLAFLEGKIYLAMDKMGLQIVDVSTPSAPVMAGSVDTPGTATGVALAGTYAYIADDDEGLHIININPDLAAPELIATYKVSGRALECATDGEFAYIAYEQAGVHVVHTAAPGVLEETATFSPAGDPQDIEVQGEYAYVADEEEGLFAVHIGNPNTPILADLITRSNPQRTECVEICGDYAFFSGYNIGLTVVDISDPYSMEEIGWYTLSIEDYTSRIFRSGEYMYMTYWKNGGETGLEIINIADTFAPQSVGTLNLDSMEEGYLAHQVYVQEDRAYIAYGNGGLVIADISDLDNLHVDTTYPSTEKMVALTSDETYMYTLLNNEGLQVIDPSGPSIIGAYGGVEMAYDIMLQGEYAFIANGSESIVVLRIAEPDQPTTAGFLTISYPHNIKGITVSGGYGFAADDAIYNGGMIIYDLFPWGLEK